MDNSKAIYDARSLGKPRMFVLGVQHMFAMFGATIMVPILTGLDVSTTLLMAGLGTLLFHVITKFKVPAFLGSSFAFLGGYAAIAPLKDAEGNALDNSALLPYACLGVACAGAVYFVLALIIKSVGVERVMRFFPPVVTGPIIIAIGLGLAPSAIDNCSTNWVLALIAFAVIIVFNIWGKGMAKIVPIILGLLISSFVGLVLASFAFQFPELKEQLPWLFSSGPILDAAGNVTGYKPIFDFEAVKTIIGNIGQGHIFGENALINLPVSWNQTIFGGINWSRGDLIISAIIAIVPISLATMMEHIGDISAISSTVGRD